MVKWLNSLDPFPASLMIRPFAEWRARYTAYLTQRDFVDTVRELGVTPHVARRQHGAIDERTSRHPGYAISLSKRWLVEKPFGWLKQIGPLKKVKLRGLAKVDWLFVFSCAVFNLIRIPKLRAQSA